MKRKLLIAFGIMALLLGFHVSIKPGEFRAAAQAGVCQFAGYGPAGQLINTTITCSTPSTGPQGTPAAGTCIGVSTPPAAGTISNLCTPSPIPNGDIMANISGISAIPAPSTGSAILDALFSSTQGSILYRGASAWLALGPGTSGQFLETLGAAANPQWSTPPNSVPAAVVTASPPITVTETTSNPPTYQVACASCGPSIVAQGKTWSAACLGETSATHCWVLSTAAAPTTCPSTIPDLVGNAGTATANPSPVPLNVIDPGARLTCGVPGMLRDGTSSAIAWPGGPSPTASPVAYVQLPNPVVSPIGPAPAAYSVEIVAAPVIMATPSSTVYTYALFHFDDAEACGAAGGMCEFIVANFPAAGGGPGYGLDPTGSTPHWFDVAKISTGPTYDFMVTCASNTTVAYINGEVVASGGGSTCNGPAGSNPVASVGMEGSGTGTLGSTFMGRIAAVGLYNTALSPTQVWIHYATLAQ